MANGNYAPHQPTHEQARIDEAITRSLKETPEGGTVTLQREQVHGLVTQVFDLEAKLEEMRREHDLALAEIEQAQQDGLTKLKRKEAFLAYLEAEIERRLRHDSGFSVLFIDIDHFKHVNDTYGHLAGDEVLRKVGELLSDATRQRAGDMVARYGGEEIICLGQGTNGSAILLAERLRALVEKTVFSFGESVIRITISVGVAIYEKDERAKNVADIRNGLIERADKALYAAKGGGRNRVCIFDSSANAPKQVTEKDLEREREKHPRLAVVSTKM